MCKAARFPHLFTVYYETGKPRSLPEAPPLRSTREGERAAAPMALALPRASGPAQEGLRPVARRSPSCIFAFQVHHHFHGYPHAAHTPYARLWARAATCTFMSQSPARGALANSLSLSGLQNGLSCILKQAVLQCGTGCPALPYAHTGCRRQRPVAMALAAHWQALAGCGHSQSLLKHQPVADVAVAHALVLKHAGAAHGHLARLRIEREHG